MKHIKVFILSAIFFIYTSFTFSQTFEVEIGTLDRDEVAHDAVQEDDGNYVILSQQGDFYMGDYPKVIIYRIDDEGSILNTLEINIDDDINLSSIQNIFPDNNNSYIVVGNCKDRSTGFRMQYLCKFSSDFEFIMDTVIGPASESDLMVDYILNSKGHLIGVGKSYSAPTNNVLIKEFSTTGELLKRKIIEWPTVSGTSLAEHTNGDYYNIVTYPSTSAIMKVDINTLEIVDTVQFSGLLFSALKMLNCPSGNSMLIAGKKNISTSKSNHKPGFFFCDENMQLSNENIYGQPDTNYFFHKDAIDFVNDTTIYFASTHNFSQWPYLANEHRWIFMNKLKTDGTIIWQRFYKGKLNYMPYKVLATNDGGALILSHKYDWNKPESQRDIHILKIDSTGWYEGLPTGTGEYGQPKQILVYPNPAHDLVHFEPGLYRNLELKLFDQNGHLLLTRPLHSHQTINLSGYPKGLYIYVVQSPTGFLEKGKLIKQ